MANSAVQHRSKSDERLVLNAYKRLMRDLSGWCSKADRKQIRYAFEYANKAHIDQRRKSGEPYITHPLEVARIVVREIGLNDPVAIQAALLHDVVEDTEATHDDIVREFGTEVAAIVRGLTKIADVFDLTTTSKQAENFRKMLLTLSHDIRVALVKIADRLHNMRTLDTMKPTGQLRISAETEIVYAPLAHRFGLYEIKSELNDLVLKYTEPDVYTSINNKLSATESQRKRYITSS